MCVCGGCEWWCVCVGVVVVSGGGGVYGCEGRSGGVCVCVRACGG